MSIESPILAVNFGTDGGRAPGDLLFDRLQAKIPGLRRVAAANALEGILLFNLDAHLAPGFFEGRRFPPGAFKVFLVHELDRRNIVFLKNADLIVYGSPFQKALVEDLIGLRYPSVVLPFPSLGVGNRGADQAFIYFGEAYEPGMHRYFLDALKACYGWFSPFSVHKMILCLAVEDHFEKEVREAVAEFEDNHFVEFELVNPRKNDGEMILEKAQGCAFGEYFHRDMGTAAFGEFMAKRDFRLIYNTLASDPIASAMAKFGWERNIDFPGISTYYYDRPGEIPDLDRYCLELEGLVRNGYDLAKRAGFPVKQSCPVDTFGDLDILHGSPLHNRYIFSICFRNQAEKIARCIRSILAQNQSHDFGLAIVDDCSDDDSSRIVLEECLESGIDFILVKNKERRYAARNFYNVIHLLIAGERRAGEESVVVEVDGDDFLAGNKVLDVLDGHYRRGCLKTFGSHKFYPVEQTFSDREKWRIAHESLDFGRPWNLGACNSWLHLRSTSLSILRKIGIEYFLERSGQSWLRDRHDAAIHPRAIELSQGRIAFIEEILYMYDVSGENHDHGAVNEEYELRIFRWVDRLHGPFGMV